MSKHESTPGATDRELARLQGLLLKAVLLNEPLPGGAGQPRMADLSFILRHPHIYLSEENLAGKISVGGLPKPLRVVSPEEVRELAREEGDVAYLRFQPPKEEGDGEVWLTLEGRLATRDEAQSALGLSSVQVKFRKADGGWESTGETRALAS